MLRRHRVAKPPTYRKRQDAGSDGSGVKVIAEDDVEYYTITDVYAGTAGSSRGAVLQYMELKEVEWIGIHW